jgi:hypothetical protein
MAWLRSVAGILMGTLYAISNTHDWRHLLTAATMAALGIITHATSTASAPIPPGRSTVNALKTITALGFLLLFTTPLSLNAQTKTTPTTTGKSLKAKTVVTRKNSMVHVLANVPKAVVSVVKTVTDVGEYVTGKIHDGFVKIDTAADVYVEGHTQ